MRESDFHEHQVHYLFYNKTCREALAQHQLEHSFIDIVSIEFAILKNLFSSVLHDE